MTKGDKKGRPSTFSTAVASAICDRLTNGESLREICRSEGMPDKSTVMRWLGTNEEFRDQYARAREAQADHFADEILEIADDGSNDWMERKQGEETVTVVDHEHISRSKLRVDARKWLMSKMAPKKYGDRLALEGELTTNYVLRAPAPAKTMDEWIEQTRPRINGSGAAKPTQ